MICAWAGAMERGWSGENEFREIVQLFAIRVSSREKGLQGIESQNILCNPVRNPTVSEYFTNLTGISQAKIDKEGVSFLEALESFQKFLKTERSVYCRGQGDELAFRHSCFEQGIKDEIVKGIEFLDVRTFPTTTVYFLGYIQYQSKIYQPTEAPLWTNYHGKRSAKNMMVSGYT